MEEAFKYAIILTERHKKHSDLIAQSYNFSTQKIIRQKQIEISHQVIEFLNDLQDVKSLVLQNDELKIQYQYLINYYAKNIYIKIEQFQQKINLLNFENKFVNSIDLYKKINQTDLDSEILKEKMNSYSNLIRK